MTTKQELLKLLEQTVPHLEVARMTYIAVSDPKKHHTVLMLMKDIKKIIDNPKYR